VEISKEGDVLPRDFVPTDYDVHCGHGKGCFNKPGNVRFRAIVSRFIPQYLTARTKYEKTAVLNAALDEVRSQKNDDDVTRFVVFKDSRWHTIGEDQAREKVGHCMREAVAALDGAEERQHEQKQFDVKQSSLLELQRIIFDALVTKPQKKKDSQYKQARRKLNSVAE